MTVRVPVSRRKFTRLGKRLCPDCKRDRDLVIAGADPLRQPRMSYHLSGTGPGFCTGSLFPMKDAS